MPNPEVRFTISLSIPEENFAKFEALVQQMVAGTQTESGARGYDWCLSKDRKTCKLIETYANAEAVQAHINGPVVQQLVPKLRDIVTVTNFEVYGDPGPQAAELLTHIGAGIFSIWKGITR